MPKYLFVTGKLASRALQKDLADIHHEWDYQISVLNITVAALMNVDFIARHLEAEGVDLIVIPGLCQGDLTVLEEKFHVKAVRGPKDLKDLPAFFGRPKPSLSVIQPKTKILAEIVDAPLLTPDQILQRAAYFCREGVDIIDLGCSVGHDFPHLPRVIRALKGEGYQVSIDSLSPKEILKASDAGVDYVLSVNSSNLEVIQHLNCQVVVIPDPGQGIDSLYRNIETLEAAGVEYIIDPILEPISFGFVESICRFQKVRRRYPEKPMLMGIGNVTELTDADSTGLNALLLGIATELEIDYVLTTEACARTRGAVREAVLAARLMHYARDNSLLPKNIAEDLITVKDPRVANYSKEELLEIQMSVRDKNYRIFTDGEQIHVFNSKVFISGVDIQNIFNQLQVQDPGHAFYLGKELMKARIALHLGKKYIQEGELRWGYLK